MSPTILPYPVSQLQWPRHPRTATAEAGDRGAATSPPAPAAPGTTPPVLLLVPAPVPVPTSASARSRSRSASSSSGLQVHTA